MGQSTSLSKRGSGLGRAGRNRGDKRNSRIPRVAMAIAMGAVVAEISPLFSRSALAADGTWTGATSQDFNLATNWSGGVFPTGGTATINLSTGNFPLFTGTQAFTPTDIVVGGSGTAGRIDVRSGTLTNGNGNWTFVGCAQRNRYDQSRRYIKHHHQRRCFDRLWNGVGKLCCSRRQHLYRRRLLRRERHRRLQHEHQRQSDRRVDRRGRWSGEFRRRHVEHR